MKDIDLINGLIGVDYHKLNSFEKRVQLLMYFYNEVVNGGWDQYLWNSAGNYAQDFNLLLPKLKYPGISKAFSIITQLFGGKIPHNRDERIEKLEKIRKSISETNDSMIIDLIDQNIEEVFDDMLEYVSKHREHFLTTRS